MAIRIRRRRSTSPPRTRASACLRRSTPHIPAITWWESVRADRAAVESVRATLAADQNAAEAANLQLSYCTIYSPIDGRTGHLMVKQGNVVKANEVDLVTINQVRPMYVTFTVPETALALVKTHMAAGAVSVEVYL